jgi:hypothetical protein
MEKVKKLKDKKCKQCKLVFSPLRPFQIVCCYKCSYDYVKAQTEKKKAKEEKKEKKEWMARKKVLKEKTKKKSEYEHDLEVEVNHIVRLIDKGHECISSKAKNYQVNAGHMYSVGSFPALRFNLLNIYNQSVHDNMYQSGNGVIYKERIKEIFGQEISEEIEGLKIKYQVLKLSIPELKETIKVARQCVRDLMKVDSDKPYTTEERIELRRFYNSVLNIYQ